MDTIADSIIKDLKEMGIDKGAIIKGLNNGKTTEIIGALKVIADSDDDVIIVADTDFSEDFRIYADKLVVKIIKKAEN
jgi:hypothetical protein